MSLTPKRNLKAVLLSPFVIPLYATLILLPFLAINFNRYTLKVESCTVLGDHTNVWYDDLDMDGESEKIIFFDKDNGSGLTISNKDGFLEQWNVTGTFGFSNKATLFITGDYDNNRLKEVYFFSIEKDSILLHCIPKYTSPDSLLRNRFIAVTGPGLKKPDPFIINAEMDDLDCDGKKELIFGIGSGFSFYPRSIFAYYIEKDSLVASPPSSAFILHILQADIDGDKKREIIPYGYAASNIDSTKVKLHDQSSWLMVLDKNLKFKFDPLELKGHYCSFTPLFSPDTLNPIFAGFHCLKGSDNKSALIKMNSAGNEICKHELDEKSTIAFVSIDSKGRCEFVIGIEKTGFIILNQDFNFKRKTDIIYSEQCFNYDFDLDNKKETLISVPEENCIYVFRSGLRSPAILRIDLNENIVCFVSLVLRKNKSTLISVQVGQINYFLNYEKNKWYYTSYALLLIVYMGFLLFALIIQRTQKVKMQEKYLTEKKIAELQLNLIRNQIDPHFTLNSINSIIYSLNNNSHEKSAEYLRGFASLYRGLMDSATTIRRSIIEEIEFCENYLLLERMRSSDSFSYSIELAPDVDRSKMVPKMVLQVFVENAIKHGISLLECGGRIQIQVKMAGEDLILKIEDNGIGREASAKLIKATTGKGIKLMEEYFEVYRRFYKQEVNYDILDLTDPEGRASGTIVTVKIMKNES